MTDLTHDAAAPPSAAAPTNDAEAVTKAKLSQTATQMSEKASTKVSELSEKAGATAQEVSKAVGERAGIARDWAADQTDVLRDTVQTRPFASAASAFAAGLVIGILLTR